MANTFDADRQWERVAAELRAVKAAQEETWGVLDNALLGRYLAGEASADEQTRVERELLEHPELRMLTDLVRDVLAEYEPATETGTPVHEQVVLPFAQVAAARVERRGFVRRILRQRGALAAAACLLLVLGLAVEGLRPHGSLVPQHAGLDNAQARAVHVGPGQMPFVPQPLDPTPLLGGPEIAVARMEQPLAKLEVIDQKVAALQGQGKVTEALALAGQVPDLAKQARVENEPRFAFHLNRVGQLHEARGDLDQAEKNYSRAHTICQQKLGPNDPRTVESLNLLANTYQLALNQNGYATAPTLVNPYAPQMQATALAPGTDPKKAVDATGLQERLARRRLGEVKQQVVPVLTRALQHARSPQERIAYIQALAQLGPAARGAMPELAACLEKARDVTERQTVVAAMGQMGPSADRALGYLADEMKHPEQAVRKTAGEALAQYGPAGVSALNELAARGDKAQRDAAHAALRQVQRTDGRVGVEDASGWVSVRTFIETRRELGALARTAGLPVYVEVVAGLAKDQPADKFAEKRGREIGGEGIFLVVSCEQPAVAVHVSEALQKRGFTIQLQNALRDAMEKALKNGDCDGALQAAVQYLTQFANARKGK